MSSDCFAHGNLFQFFLFITSLVFFRWSHIVRKNMSKKMQLKMMGIRNHLSILVFIDIVYKPFYQCSMCALTGSNFNTRSSNNTTEINQLMYINSLRQKVKGRLIQSKVQSLQRLAAETPSPTFIHFVYIFEMPSLFTKFIFRFRY